jgi:hypothetical protein
MAPGGSEPGLTISDITPPRMIADLVDIRIEVDKVQYFGTRQDKGTVGDALIEDGQVTLEIRHAPLPRRQGIRWEHSLTQSWIPSKSYLDAITDASC